MFLWIGLTALAAGPINRPRQSSSAGCELVYSFGSRGLRGSAGIALVVQHHSYVAPLFPDSDSGLGVGPLMTLGAHVGWTPPAVWAEATVVGGFMRPAVPGTGGFRPLYGAQGGLGLHLGTDGAAGPVFVVSGLGPVSEVRLELTHWRGWYDPRLLIGPLVSLTCCDVLVE